MTAVGYTGGDPHKVNVAGDTMTGPLVLPADPVSPLQAATMQYVDAHSGGGGGGSGTPSNTVVSGTSYGQASGAGVAIAYSRGDHTHGTPALGLTGTTAAAGNHNHSGTYDPFGSAASALSSALAADVPLGNTTPTAEAIGDTGSVGVASTSAHADHRHAMPVFGSVTAQTSFGASAGDGVASSVAHSDHTHGTPTAPTVPSASSSVAAETSYGVSSNAGAAATFSRGDHTHGSPSLTANTPTASAVGDTGAVGTGTAPAKDDHKHAREAFGAVTAQTSYGSSSGNGVATTIARSDHTHGTPALSSTTPTTSAVGDAAAIGSGTTAAKSDHTHGREAFGNVVAQTSFGASSTNGVATTEARSDHAHGTPAAPTAASVGAPALSVLTTKGDLYAATGAGAVARQAVGSNGDVLRANSANSTGWETANNRQTQLFAFTGTATVQAGVLRWYNRTGRTLNIIGAWAAANTQPTGAALVVDVNKNGTTIYTTQGNRPSVSVSTNGGAISVTPDVTTIADGDYITVDVDVIGSTIAGADVTVGVVYW
jgi:hypothetical protein